MRKKTYLLLLVFLIGAVPAGVFWFATPGPGARGPAQSGGPLPDPNGYDDFLMAGQVVTVPKAPGTNAGAEELRALVTPNAGALKLVREGLMKECRMPIGFSPEYYVETNPVIALECKALDMVLEAEGRLAEIERRTNDAVVSYLDAVRFSHESSRGGYKINLMVGEHGEAAGLGRLRQLLGSLDAGQCRMAIKTMTTLEEKREPVGDVLARDKKWWQNHGSLGEQIKFMPALAKDPSLNPLNMLPELLEKNTAERQRQARQLIIDLAARCYELEKGTRPRTTADLTPGYLDSIPRDPVTGANMVLSP